MFSEGFATLMQASFNDDYWKVHQQLESRGLIGHLRDRCPERDGPRMVRAWAPGPGWHDLAVAHRAQ